MFFQALLEVWDPFLGAGVVPIGVFDPDTAQFLIPGSLPMTGAGIIDASQKDDLHGTGLVVEGDDHPPFLEEILLQTLFFTVSLGTLVDHFENLVLIPRLLDFLARDFFQFITATQTCRHVPPPIFLEIIQAFLEIRKRPI
jgi:hypothetical protein